MPDWTLIIAQKSTVVKIDVLCSDILTDRLLGSTLICNELGEVTVRITQEMDKHNPLMI